MGLVLGLETENFKSEDITLGKIYNSEEFKEKYHYDGNLGAQYDEKKTKFTLWAPTAKNVKLALYGKNGNDIENSPTELVQMNKGEQGEWSIEVKGNLNGEYYNYIVEVNGKENEVTDPYAKAVGVNGNRAMVIDLKETNPQGWDKDKKTKLEYATDAVIYEMHIRDFSIDDN